MLSSDFSPFTAKVVQIYCRALFHNNWPDIFHTWTSFQTTNMPSKAKIKALSKCVKIKKYSMGQQRNSNFEIQLEVKLH